MTQPSIQTLIVLVMEHCNTNTYHPRIYSLMQYSIVVDEYYCYTWRSLPSQLV